MNPWPRALVAGVIAVALVTGAGCRRAEPLSTDAGLGTPAVVARAIRRAKVVSLQARDEPDLKKDLTRQEINVFAAQVAKTTLSDFGSPHGAGYPDYRLVASLADGNTLIVELQDRATMAARYGSKAAYFQAPAELYDTARTLLPIPAPVPEDLGYLFGATSLSIAGNDPRVGSPLIVYDLSLTPSAAFRLADLVRVMRQASLAPSAARWDPRKAMAILTFTVNGQDETVLVFDDFVVYRGRVFFKAGIGRTLGTTINAG